VAASPSPPGRAGRARRTAGAGGALNLPSPGDLAGLSAPAVYATLFGIIFVESGLVVGFLLPGDSILFAAGLLAAEPGSSLSLPVLAAGAFVCAVTGNVVGYWTGHRFGRPWLLARAGRAARHVERAERFYQRYGWLAVVAARFIPWARTFTPVAAGVADMGRAAFVSATLVGAAVWGAGLVVLGYLAHDVPWLARLALAVAAVAVAASVLVPLGGWTRRRVRNHRTQISRSANP
jgi:membrane-associated protein